MKALEFNGSLILLYQSGFVCIITQTVITAGNYFTVAAVFIFSVFNCIAGPLLFKIHPYDSMG